MPVIRPSGRSSRVDSYRLRLTELLLKELMGEMTHRGPVVFEDPSEPDAIDVIVVWEAWEGLAPSDRTSIIREAYARYSKSLEASVHYIDPARIPDSPMVTRALGATWKDVEKLGLLPFSIVPDVGAEPFDPEDLEYLMIEAGAIRSPAGIQLRFPKGRMAMEVCARLLQEMPEARWKIVEEADAFDD